MATSLELGGEQNKENISIINYPPSEWVDMRDPGSDALRGAERHWGCGSSDKGYLTHTWGSGKVSQGGEFLPD